MKSSYVSVDINRDSNGSAEMVLGGVGQDKIVMVVERFVRFRMIRYCVPLTVFALKLIRKHFINALFRRVAKLCWVCPEVELTQIIYPTRRSNK